jgi:catechol 2,3-dioxygenase-like lactoylglutathione lyase family enzyme
LGDNVADDISGAPAGPTGTAAAPFLESSEAILAVGDVPRTVAFYREVLGFENQWLWGDPPTFGGVRWGKIGLMFCQQPELAARLEGHQHWFGCEEIDALHKRHLAAGASIISPIEDKPWNTREYTVRDPNGYHLRFGGSAHHARPAGAPAQMPADIRIVERTPSPEEYAGLIEAVGWTRYGNADTAPLALSRSLYCIVATDGTRPIGMGRIVGDNASAFYVQDVLVIPDRQHQRIGTAIMDALMAHLQRVARSNAFIGLFTGGGVAPFYERYGFCGSGTGLIGMFLRKNDLPLGRRR